MFQTTIFKMLGSAALVITLVSCASSVKKERLAEDTNPQTALEELRSDLSTSQAQQFDKLAPDSFDKAKKYAERAEEGIKDKDDREDIIDDLEKGFGYSKRVKTVGAKHNEDVQAILVSRKAALDAQASNNIKAFKSAENRLEDLGEDMERGNYKMSAERDREIQDLYASAELQAIQNQQLGNARNHITMAKDNGAKGNAPSTYALATSKLSAAEGLIASNRHTPSAYSSAVEEANNEAWKLLSVSRIVKRNKTNEKSALQIFEQEQLIAGQDRKINAAEADLSTVGAALTAQSAALTQTERERRDLAAKQRIADLIALQREKFDRSEAELLQDGNRLIVRLKQSQFAINSADLKDSSAETMKKVSEMIAALPVQKVTVEGHTDSVGTKQVNQSLSEKRAEAVKEYLAKQGDVPEDKITAEGFGFEKPVASNKSAAGRALNRRVDVVVETASINSSAEAIE
ncbi:MAG: OmpA family protein [Bdellovibrionota bacterium]